jgi:glycosyltransferase involved in cell wall biosynthesis
MQDLAGWRQLAHAEVAAGHLPPRTFLARAAAVLSPTRFDVHPLVLVEAVAWGIPVVCSDLEGTRCAAGLGALYVDRAAPTDAWAGALRTVLEQPRPRLRQRPYAEVVQAALGELELRRAA